MQTIHSRALWALLAGMALVLQAATDVRAADASSFDTKALAYRTKRVLNDAGQFYMAWWIPPTLFQALMRDSAAAPPATIVEMQRALDPYIVFASSRGQEGAKQLEDVRERADLLAHSRLSLDGQELPAAAEQVDPAALAALTALRPLLEAMLGRDGHGLEFALYPYAPGMHALDATAAGSIDYTMYRKRFHWKLPVWDPVAAAPLRATPVPMPLPGPAAPAAAMAAPAAAAVAVGTAPALQAPLPMQRRKIDPTSGEEFPERYNYNPYTGQKLVSQ